MSASHLLGLQVPASTPSLTYIYHNNHSISKVKTMQDCKVDKFLKGSLDSMQSSSPSLKIQIIGGKVCLKCKGKTLLAFCFQKFVDITQQCFALLLEVNFPVYNFNFH